MDGYVLIALLGFQLKHLVADYFLQTGSMIAGKGDLRHPGGYAHAGVHVLGSTVILLFVGAPIGLSIALLAAEAVIHYAIDFGKAHWSKFRPAAVTTRAFWAAQGTDQFLHQVTYVAMTAVVAAPLA